MQWYHGRLLVIYFISASDKTNKQYSFTVNAISQNHAAVKAKRILHTYDAMPKSIIVFTRLTLPDVMRNKPFGLIRIK